MGHFMLLVSDDYACVCAVLIFLIWFETEFIGFVSFDPVLCIVHVLMCVYMYYMVLYEQLPIGKGNCTLRPLSGDWIWPSLSGNVVKSRARERAVEQQWQIDFPEAFGKEWAD